MLARGTWLAPSRAERPVPSGRSMMMGSIRALAFVIAPMVVLVVAPAAAAQVSFFHFDWNTSAEFSTFDPATFETSRISGTISGHGVLALARPPELNGGFFFEFSGAGGGGFGQTLPDRRIVPGQISNPLPPSVPVPTRSAVSGFSGGMLELI